MPVLTRIGSREPRATIFELFADLLRGDRDALERIPDTPNATNDAAACLLGLDLWRGPLARYRNHLTATGERPHLWTFSFGPSRAWEASRWSSLTLPARTVRARAGHLDRPLRTRLTAWSLGMEPSAFREGLTGLQNAGLAVKYRDGAYELAPLASPSELCVDLALVEIISHWFWRLADRERALADPHATGFEVHGYDECCSICRAGWGLRERDPQRVPPFHPGCRCFAQPRFV